jgi:hypothetical protein
MNRIAAKFTADLGEQSFALVVSQRVQNKNNVKK